MSRWAFLTNHAIILSFLARHPLITARELSFEIGITERAVMRIIAELKKDGYIASEKEGRRVRYQIDPCMPLRHKAQKDMAVGDLLQVLGWQEKRVRKSTR